MRLLILTDDEGARAAVVSALAEGGFPPPVFASDAAEACALAATERPAVLLVDIARCGPEACRLLREPAAMKDVPLLALTDRPAREACEEAAAADAHDFVCKPACVGELIGRVRAALAFRRQLDECRRHTRELERVNGKLAELAVIDELTGVPNRRFFNHVAAREWARAAREGSPLSLILIDIDHFKWYNDHYGHQRGDECLRRVALALAGEARRPGDVVARYGGEEFAALLARTALPGALSVAETLRTRVEALGLEHGASPGGRVTISLGVASTVPQRARSLESLLGAADSAIYAAKREGRNCTRTCPAPPQDAGRVGQETPT